VPVFSPAQIAGQCVFFLNQRERRLRPRRIAQAKLGALDNPNADFERRLSSSLMITFTLEPASSGIANTKCAYAAARGNEPH
jgi:hypothetical protein